MITRFFLNHLQAMLNSLGQMSRTPFTSLMICLIIGITLSLPTALFVLLKNMEGLTRGLQQTTQITLYLKKDASSKEANSLVKKLENHSLIQSVQSISPEQGLQELQQHAGLTELNNTLHELQNNPLPWALVIVPRTLDKLDTLTEELKKLPLVDSVQIDRLWVQRLVSLLNLAKQTAYALALFLGAAVIIIINHTIRTATQQNQKEIKIIQLLGGTHAFIRRPFVYTGMLYGLLGGIIAWHLVGTIMT